MSGASSVDEIKTMLNKAGFRFIKVDEKDLSEEYLKKWGTVRDISKYVKSSIIKAVK